MQQRVACQGQGRFGRACGAHRDLALSRVCFVCGSSSYTAVAPTRGDRYVALSRCVDDLFAIRATPDVLSIREAVAVSERLSDANSLELAGGANLRGADLGDSDLRGVNLTRIWPDSL